MSERLSASKAKGELLAGEPTAEPPPRPDKPAYHFTGEIPPALARLRDEPCWVAWEYVLKNGRWTKPPRDPRTGRGASVSDPQTWATFDLALAGMERHGLDGVGLVLTVEDDLIGIDLDDCITDAGTFSPLAAEIIGYGESYAEVSPSGEGIRIFIRGKIERALKDDATGVEVYSTGRYLTVTGNQVDGTPSEIRLAPRTLDKLTAIVGGAREAKRLQSVGLGNQRLRRRHDRNLILACGSVWQAGTMSRRMRVCTIRSAWPRPAWPRPPLRRAEPREIMGQPGWQPKLSEMLKIEYLCAVAREDPKAFCALLGKLIPVKVAGDAEDPPVLRMTIDAPPNETREQWLARTARERGITRAIVGPATRATDERDEAR